jgi:enoyl-CoA hydratase
MDGHTVRYHRDEGVGIITLDRPPVNAYDGLLHFELETAWQRAADDADVHVVLLQAEGKHFCGGANMGSQSQPRPDSVPPPRTPWDEYNFVRNLPKPTIAAVQGGCVGGGQRFVFPCDIIFCSNDAFFSDPLAVVGGIGGIQSPIHAWFYGPRLAKEMLYGGGRLPADRLYAMGAINRLVESGVLHAEALAFAHEISGVDAAALRQAKRSVNITLDIMGQHYITSRFAELLDEQPRLTMPTPPE